VEAVVSVEAVVRFAEKAEIVALVVFAAAVMPAPVAAEKVVAVVAETDDFVDDSC
jgi:hypothetical protein